MKFKRTILIFALVLVLTFVLTACSTGPSDAPEPPPSPSSEETTDETASESESGQAEPSSELSSEPSDPAQTDDSILVAYFSHTGNTEAVAGRLPTLRAELSQRSSGLKNTATCKKKRKLKFWTASILRLQSV